MELNVSLCASDLIGDGTTASTFMVARRRQKYSRIEQFRLGEDV
jgi:hypothetical protein